MRVLVTGSAGRVGTAVVRELLEHGFTVRALDRRPPHADLRERVETVYADVADPLALMTAVAGCDAIAHLAAYPHPHNVTPSELLRVNVIGTQNVLDAAMAVGIPRVVLTSSIGALGFSFPVHLCLPDYLPLDIAHTRRPQDIYGVSKVMNEESAAAATRLSGLTTIVLRPPGVFDLESAKERGWLARTKNRNADEYNKDLWSYIDSRDQAAAYLLALTADITGHHVFYTMADDVIADATPRELVERFLPQLAPDLPKLTGRSLYDLTPARNLLGFQSQYTWRGVLEG